MILLDKDYPRPWAGYTVPEFGGRLNGPEEDAAILSSVVSDAKATEAIHRDMIQHMIDWDKREPGILSTDADLRNAFIANLDGLRDAFTQRGLQMVGVMFPISLDRSDPAHAVILAVRDDIADTRDQLQANRSQYVLGKQVSDAKISLPERVITQTIRTTQDLTAAAARVAEDAGKGAKSLLEALPWIVGGGFGLALLYQMSGGKK